MIEVDRSPHLDPDDVNWWQTIEPTWEPIDGLVLSQDSLSIQELLEPPDGADLIPVHAYRRPDGRLRLVNGHHRYARARLRGAMLLLVRVAP